MWCVAPWCSAVGCSLARAAARLLYSPLDWTGAFDEICEREPSEGFELMAFGAKGAHAPPAPAARGVAPTQRPRHGRLQA